MLTTVKSSLRGSYRTFRIQKACRRSLFNVSSFLPTSTSTGTTGGGRGGGEQRYHERKILPYSRRQLYDLVADVDSYHRFLPFCTSSKVLRSRVLRPSESPGRPAILRKEAELTVGFLAIQESYVSEVTCTPYLSVEAVASSTTPLFTKLVTVWRFQPADPSSPHLSSKTPTTASSDATTLDDESGPTLLSIDLSFAFANPLYAGVSSTFFGKISGMMVDAFERRCHEVYGRGTS